MQWLWPDLQQCRMFGVHKQLRKSGTVYCGEIFICELCEVFVSPLNRKDPDAKHFCIEMFCKTCAECYFKLLLQTATSNFWRMNQFYKPSHGTLISIIRRGINKRMANTTNVVIAQYASGAEMRLPKDPQPLAYSQKTAKDFGKWPLERHNTKKAASNGKSDFRTQKTSYCSNGVNVLRKCAIKFRKDFIALTDSDPIQSATIATACQKVFRTFMLKREEIAVIPAHGWQSGRKTN